MADDKDLKNKANKEVEKAAAGKTKKTDADKTLEEAQQALTNSKQDTKSKNAAKIKQMTAYQEQALQEATKSKGNKKVLIILLILLGLAILIGGGVALFFALKPEPEEEGTIVCDVRVLSYSVQNNVDPEQYVVVGEGDEFHFTEETEKTDHFTKEIDIKLSDVRDVAMMYIVDNVSGDKYVYSINFEDLIIMNCDVTIKSSISDDVFVIDSSRRIVELAYDKDITFEIRISVKDADIADETNTGCDGNINLTLSVS